MLTTWQEEEKEREEGEEESIAEKEKEKLCHTIYRLWKISNNGLQSFFFLRLIFIVHPSTDGLPYGLKNELASRVNYILHWRMDRSEPWPTYRALREFESQSHTTNRSNPVSNSSMLSVRVSIIVERSSRRFLFNHLRDFPQNVKPTCQSVKLISIDMRHEWHDSTTRFDRFDVRRDPILIYLDSRIRLFEGTFAALVPLRRSDLYHVQ